MAPQVLHSLLLTRKTATSLTGRGSVRLEPAALRHTRSTARRPQLRTSGKAKCFLVHCLFLLARQGIAITCLEGTSLRLPLFSAVRSSQARCLAAGDRPPIPLVSRIYRALATLLFRCSALWTALIPWKSQFAYNDRIGSNADAIESRHEIFQRLESM